jgi:hypothetical protein
MKESIIVEEKITLSNIGICYNYIKNKLPPEEICIITHKKFNELYKNIKNKKIEDKCLEFMKFRQKMISYLINDYFSIDNDSATLNSMLGYFDCSFSILFFKNKFDLTPINEIIDDEFYFALFPIIIDKIEFPSMFNHDISQSYLFKNRRKIKLQRRNFLSNLMVCSRLLIHEIITSLTNYHKSVPSWEVIDKEIKKNKIRYLLKVANINSYNEKMMNLQKTKNNKFIIYRGYDIDASEDVLIDRKIRLQDTNKSFSFTTNLKVAEMFSTYKTNESMDEVITTYDDRITLVSLFIDKKISNRYQSKSNRKHIVAKFEINEEDIIITPFFISTTESEVVAIPDNAKLIRYNIVHSS